MSANGEMGNGEPGKQVKDDEGKSQTAAIRRIQKLRDELADFGLSFAQNELDRQFGERAQLRAYYQLVRGTTQQLRGVLTDGDIPQAKHYWNDCEIGAITVHPPQPQIDGSEEDALKSNNTVAMEWMRMHGGLEPRTYSIVGLEEFLEIGDPEWMESWEVQFGLSVDQSELRRSLNDPNVEVQKGAGLGTYVISKPAHLDRRIIDNAAAQLQSFIRELGMGIEVDDEEQQTKIDRDLLEEVDEWRKQNVN